MNIAPRKDEWAPLVELLESGDFDTPESLAKAIVKQTYKTFLEREWFLTLVRLDPHTIAYGLSPTETAARRLELGGGHPRQVVAVTSAEGQVRKVEEAGW